MTKKAKATPEQKAILMAIDALKAISIEALTLSRKTLLLSTEIERMCPGLPRPKLKLGPEEGTEVKHEEE